MKYAYTAVFKPTEDGAEYYANVPDLPGCVTTGTDIEDAISQITDAAGGWLVFAEDEGLPINPPTPQKDIVHSTEDTLSVISVDTNQYRRLSGAAVAAKVVYLPEWMSELADRYTINCSIVLQNALEELLHAG